MTIPPAPERAASTRQVLSKRQAATVDALLGAGMEALHDVGFDSLSLRDVAARAGVTHTTAYTYFTSKEHLVAETYLRLLLALPTPDADQSVPLSVRLVEALRCASEMFNADEAFAEAVLAAMVARDPDLERIRTSIGNEIARRIQVAVGPDADPRMVQGALLLYSGAMMEAGLNYSTFGEVVERIGVVAEYWNLDDL